MVRINKIIGITSEHFLKFYDHHFTVENKSILVKLKFPIRTIERKKISQYLFEKIRNNPNINLFTNTVVTLIKDNIISTNRGNYTYKYLVGADGSNSLVRKYLGLKNKYFIGIQYRLTHLKDTKMEWIFSPRILKKGYVWVFPHKNYVLIGCGFDPNKVNGQKTHEFLKSIIKSRGYNIENKPVEAAPVNCNYQGWKFDNIYLIGDAAGLSPSLSGEGVPFVVISGREIARYIIDNNYKLPELNKILTIKNRQERIAIIFNIFSIFPNLFSIFLIFILRLVNFGWFQSYFFGYGILHNKKPPRSGQARNFL